MSSKHVKFIHAILIALCSIFVAILPYACKWITMMPQSAYRTFSIIFFVVAIIAAIICLCVRKKKDGEESSNQYWQWPIYSLILGVSFLSLTFIYPSIRYDELQTYSFEGRMNQLDSLRFRADKGDLDAMLQLSEDLIQPLPIDPFTNDLSLVDYREAEKYLQKASEEMDSPEAYATLAWMKNGGYGRMKSRKHAINYIAEGSRIDPTNSSILRAIEFLDFTEAELPEAVRALNLKKQKDAEEELVRLENLKKAEQIIAVYQEKCKEPVDSTDLINYCTKSLPILSALDISDANLVYDLAVMCLIAEEHDKGYDYGKSIVDQNGQPSAITRALFSEKQFYSEQQERIDSILWYTDNTTIDTILGKYAQPLKLDDYYIQAMKLERLKRDERFKASKELKDSPEFKSILATTMQLGQEFIDTPANNNGILRPIPGVVMHVSMNYDHLSTRYHYTYVEL